MDTQADVQPDIQQDQSSFFNYTPLAGNEIRLIELLPLSADGTTNIRLFHVDIDDLPYYNAVSYTVSFIMFYYLTYNRAGLS